MLNKVILQGRLTATPELRTTQSGTNVLAFTVAVDRDYKQEGGQTVDFINCVAWRKTAEFISAYFTKGQDILLTGEIQVRPYTAKDGSKRTATEVIVASVNFCGRKQTGENTEASPSEFEEIGDTSEELPF